ncbi:MAG TPA: ABC transporter permease [Vicinamibacterales bacterium]
MPHNWTRDLRARLAALHLAPEREAEVVEEVSQHLDDRYEELRAGGASDAEARRIALDEISAGGGLEARMRGLAQAHIPTPISPGTPDRGLLSGAWQDLRYAARMIRRQPGFAAIIVATLAAGIAVNTLVFTIVNGAALRPLPFDEPEQLVRLRVTTADARSPVSNLSYLDVHDWQEARRTFEHIAVAAERMMDLSGDQQPPVRVQAAVMSWNLTALLRVPPAFGRDFTADDDRPGAPPVAIIADDVWRTRYAADIGVLGKTIRVDGVPTTIVGIMPPRFGFPDRAQLWVPLAALPEQERVTRGARTLNAVGRLRRGVTIEQAQSELAAIAATLAERYPTSNRNVAPRFEPAGIARGFIPILVALLGAVGSVLLIACANVANLLLARAADRARDVTLRLALGASRWRIVRQLLAESLVLALAGAIAGLALSYLGLHVLLANIEPDAAPPSWVQFTVDRVVLAYVAALCLGSAVVCGVLPAWQASRTNLVSALNESGRGDTGSRHRRRWTGAFVIAQVAFALVLLSGATLMMRNLADLVRIDAGVNASELLQTGFILQRSDYTPERRRLFFQRLEERLSSTPAIDAALASTAPMAGADPQRVRIDGQPAVEFNRLPVVSRVDVGRGYFDVIDAHVLAGRVFDADDAKQPGERVVVNERFARMHFSDRQAVGSRILLPPPAPDSRDAAPQWMTIVGVIGNVRQQMLPSGEFDPVVYRSYAAAPPQRMQVIARSASGPGAVAGFVRSEVQALDPDLPLFPMVTVQQAFARQFWPQRVFGSLFAAFATIALLLATCGLYGVTSYAVARRTREIGVRVALGADARRIWWVVTRTTLRQLAIGLVVGTAGAAAVAAALPAVLVGSRGADPVAYVVVVGILVTIGVTASAIPARYAMRLDPVAALQDE